MYGIFTYIVLIFGAYGSGTRLHNELDNDKITIFNG